MVYEQIAAVDLGSNSFRLEVGRVVENQIYSLDSLKAPVRLASGLNEEKILDEAACHRALQALSLFGERLRGFERGAVRAVATNTLRVAKNAREFLPEAERALGFPIEIIAGREEARLIFIGAAHLLPMTRYKRLIVDIGGGSTELIIGKKIEPLLMESLYMGCVSYSMRFFPHMRVDKKSFAEAEVSAAGRIRTIAQEYCELGWTEAAASSGTAKALDEIIAANGFNPHGETGITHEGLLNLRERLIASGGPENAKLEALRPERAPVIAGGLAIMLSVFSELRLKRMIYSEGALRQGVLYDLIGRFQHQDMREITIKQFMKRYQVDSSQVERVKNTAVFLFKQLVDINLPEHETSLRFLLWAASLHEIGLSVSHVAFHKHGAYIVRYADMPGFSKTEQERLAFLILGERGKLEKLDDISALSSEIRLLFCLRLAILLQRSRDELVVGEFILRHNAKGFELSIPANWLQENPLSASALEEESIAWSKVGLGFRIKCQPQGRKAHVSA